ncbi:MAG TPA: hypothetical protein DEE98_05035 [Elusimicrobia bacterium]|nr:MAG: hypothetical protein A2278_04710 [Elusimicrobia bacterium RIFOXYA12_FULL_49_49]OGS14652.1 MAG: hypothetical protein A2251_09130 [Elusimicrobia bacterium RIFOXYA2_FULL_47_53]OGS25695.1 MAG: hypothetical protein A2339_06460 [Elusimicrobia bacterium RIFOXYB12_FULL_50_12]OGS31743.1 MAG: hypothetical protein A2323_06040 [Elusimicrobia bacterium RIFOXYB2_FULL_46_23]HBU69729.1 hypothetical protein [Elusimicrobiota bacterium]
MGKTEKLITGFVLAVFVPVVFSMFGWWAATLLYMMKSGSLKSAVIFNGAMIGLGAGIIINLLYLSGMVKKLYEINDKLLTLAFLFLSFMVLMFFKGFVLGNILLGSAAGIYYGRRAHFRALSDGALSLESSRVSKFFGIITALAVMFVGFTSEGAATRLKDLLYIATLLLAGGASGIFQYWVSKYSIYSAFNLTGDIS